MRGRGGCYTNGLKRASSVPRLLAEIVNLMSSLKLVFYYQDWCTDGGLDGGEKFITTMVIHLSLKDSERFVSLKWSAKAMRYQLFIIRWNIPFNFTIYFVSHTSLHVWSKMLFRCQITKESHCRCVLSSYVLLPSLTLATNTYSTSHRAASADRVAIWPFWRPNFSILADF